MKAKVWETLGYLANGLSIPLLIFLTSVLDVPDFLQPLSYLGWILLGSGVGMVVLSVVSLVGNRNEGLVEDGVYGLVRHPMYLGAMLLFLSYSLFSPHWLTLLVSAVNVAIVYAFVLQGERQNIQRFGEAYERYIQAVPGTNLLAGIARCLRRR